MTAEAKSLMIWSPGHLFLGYGKPDQWIPVGSTDEGSAMDEHGEYDPVTGEYLHRYTSTYCWHGQRGQPDQHGRVNNPPTKITGLV
jgi:hypothetical protein